MVINFEEVMSSVIVMPIGDQWAIKMEGSEEVYASYEEEEEALDAAKEIALAQQKRIVVLREDGTLYTIYESDNLPSDDNTPEITGPGDDLEDIRPGSD